MGMEGKGRMSGHTASNVRDKVETRVDGGGPVVCSFGRS